MPALAAESCRGRHGALREGVVIGGAHDAVERRTATRRRTAPRAVLAIGLLLMLSVPTASSENEAPHGPAGAPTATGSAVDQAAPTDEARIFLAVVGRNNRRALRHPDPDLAERIWQASQSLVTARSMAALFPGYRSADAPDRSLAADNVDAACHDFPDLPAVFGLGVHHRTCYFAVASYLGNYHAMAARHDANSPHLAWARAYLELAVGEAESFTWGPEEEHVGTGYRDTLAAAWQNPERAVALVILAEQLRQAGALDAAAKARVADVAAGVARAWRAAFWETGVHPSHGVTLTIRIPPEVTAMTPQRRDVACRVPWSLAWDADERNTPAEEVAWMGAGAMLVARALGEELSDAAELAAAGQHYVDYALAYDRYDPVHGATIRTLSRGATSGAYGARRYWVKNHAGESPSIPYLAATWHFIGTALMASPVGEQRPWPGLVPDDEQWAVMRLATEETLKAPDGDSLIDWSVGGGLGFALEPYPLWRTACGQSGDGRSYTEWTDEETGDTIYLSEIGHAAGLDLLTAGWAVRRIAADRGDTQTYRLWTRRLERILDEYTARPPDPAWARCKFAPYISANPAYHYARFLSAYTIAYLGLSGFEVGRWTVGEGVE